MRRKLLLSAIIGLSLLMCGCGNKDIIDTVWRYDRAVLELPNGEVIDGKVEQWKDYEGDVIQVRIDGVTYYIHSENIVLIANSDYVWDSKLPTMPVLESTEDNKC